MKSFALKIFAIVALTLVAQASLRVDPETTLFVDQYGRATIHHGVNVVYKVFPFHPTLESFDSNSSLSEYDLSNLKSWGINMIRLHVAWEGVEPQKNKYNYTYIETLRDIVRKCARFNIWVLLDAHQDLMSKKFCGQGLPDWVARRTNFPHPLKLNMRFDEQGYPLREDCLSIEFGQFYLTYDVMRTQEQLYTNKYGLADSFANMWGTVAKYMASQPNLIGYEALNEPLGADLYNHPADLILPGVSNNKYLLPFYKKIYKAIRAADKNNIFFFEPGTIDVLAGGFFETPGGESDLEKQALSYHVYCPLVTKLGEPVSKPFCNSFDRLTVESKERNTKGLKIGAMLTQFGALSNTVKSAQEISDLTSYVNSRFHGWSYWQFKYYEDITTAARPGTTQSFYDQYGHLQLNKIIALSQPYAYSVCGKPYRTSLKNKTFSLTYRVGECANKFTELYLNQLYYYEHGFSVQFKPACKECVLRKLETSYYEVVVPSKIINSQLKIVVTPV